MATYYKTYGFRGRDLERVADRVAERLGIAFELRDSSYYAGEYYLFRPSHDRQMRLYSNHDEVRGCLVQEHYADYDLILEVSNLENMADVHRRLMAMAPAPTLLAAREMPDLEADDEGE